VKNILEETGERKQEAGGRIEAAEGCIRN